MLISVSGTVYRSRRGFATPTVELVKDERRRISDALGPEVTRLVRLDG
jgi:hypothetical protein